MKPEETSTTDTSEPKASVKIQPLPVSVLPSQRFLRRTRRRLRLLSQPGVESKAA